MTRPVRKAIKRGRPDGRRKLEQAPTRQKARDGTAVIMEWIEHLNERLGQIEEWIAVLCVNAPPRSYRDPKPEEPVLPRRARKGKAK